MRTVYFENGTLIPDLSYYISGLTVGYITMSSFNAEKTLRALPLWRMLISRSLLEPTTSNDLDNAMAIVGKDCFYPKVKARVDDDALMEILLLASPNDRVVY